MKKAIMTENESRDFAQVIKNKAKEFGADLAGIANIEDLKQSPSHKITEKLPEYKGVGTRDEGRKHGIVNWPEGYRSAIVIAVEHPIDNPELDWWVAGNTSGNRKLIHIVSELANWFENDRGIKNIKIPYHIERGGVYMKDSAVLAGLGCIGKNNMLITPQFGPRVRLRVMLVEADLPSDGVSNFDPCKKCPMPCRSACPQNAFGEQIYFEQEYELAQLPGRNGVYNRLACNRQMEADVSNAEDIQLDNDGKIGKLVKYCRECELSCPVGSSRKTRRQ